MSWIDLLRMSSSNLRRRKLRTFLTVLGVVIGTASIVVMISLGLGMQRSMMQEVEKSGGLTSINVRGVSSGGGSVMMGGSSDQQESTKYVTDDTIKELQQLEHITLAAPVFSIDIMLLKGNLQGYTTLVGMTPEAFVQEKIDLAEGGKLPDTGGGELQLVYGNGILTNFSDKNGRGGYWETGKYPDIDLMKDQMFLILDTNAYWSTQGVQGEVQDENGKPIKPPKKHIVKGSGVVAGAPDEYNSHYYEAYCDMDTLMAVLKKEFAGRVIPGQPSTKNGKPFNYMTYSYAKVYVDDLNNVEDVSKKIRELGYNTDSNADYLNTMKSQFAIIQAVLGGIGAISLLVAAIGIANTMMMSIYERTKEIGVIKVLGCGLKNIRQMFLLEAAFIGLLGGVIGNVLSFIMSFIVNKVVNTASIMGVQGQISYIPPWLALVSMAFAVFVGMVAGYFPALRAMRLSPLAAIRNE